MTKTTSQLVPDYNRIHNQSVSLQDLDYYISQINLVCEGLEGLVLTPRQIGGDNSLQSALNAISDEVSRIVAAIEDRIAEVEA